MSQAHNDDDRYFRHRFHTGSQARDFLGARARGRERGGREVSTLAIDAESQQPASRSVTLYPGVFGVSHGRFGAHAIELAGAGRTRNHYANHTGYSGLGAYTIESQI